MTNDADTLDLNPPAPGADGVAEAAVEEPATVPPSTPEQARDDVSVQFEQVKAGVHLDDMDLGDLTELNTHLSNLRTAAGGALRDEIYQYALTVNEWISRRVTEREEELRAAREADPEKARLHQQVGTVGFDGGLEQLIESRVQARLLELTKGQG